MSVSEKIQNILDYIDEQDINESERNELVDELTELDTDFQDLQDRLIDEQTTRLPELSNLRPNSKIMRNNKINLYTYWEFIEKKIDKLDMDRAIRTASEDALEEHGASRGVVRKQLAKATGTIWVGSSIPPDKLYTIPTLFMVGTPGSYDQEALRFIVTETPSIDVGHPQDVDGDYMIEVKIQAEEGGEAYNLNIGKITEIFTEIEYFEKVKQLSPTSGGFDLEDLEDYRDRVLQKGQASVIHSKAWFKAEAEGVDPGVQEAIIIDNINGEGSVGIIIRGTGSVVPQSVLDTVQAHFNHKDQKPMGNWRAFVKPIQTQTIDIEIDIYYEPGKTIVQSEAYSAIENYFSNLLVGEQYVREQMEAKLDDVDNVFNWVTKSPAIDVIVVPSDTLAVLGNISAQFMEYIP